VARALWTPQPNLKIAATTWILAGGAHHTGFSQALTAQHLEDFADMAGLEFLLIDRNTTVPDFKKELRRNDVYFRLAGSI
jgi:L-arabinose isomerase